jgi:hypothetical protein
MVSSTSLTLEARDCKLTPYLSRDAANQFISIQKMLYFAKLTNRVAIM